VTAPKTIDWQEWEDEIFEKARAENRPIFLVISASWCRWCKSMDETAFSNPSVVEIIEKEYVPIRVDKDKRPDINERYNMGGWPSCSVLSSDGEVVTGGTYFTADQLATLLEKVADAYRDRKEKIQDLIDATVREEEEGQQARDRSGGKLSAEIITNVMRSIIGEFDEKYGGFGQGQKFPHPEAIDFAILQYYKTNDLKLLGIINKTLESMADGDLHDSVGGGFFRYCATRDWRAPNTEKLLETNVSLLHNYSFAYQIMGRDRYFDVARRTADYICANLWDADQGAFRSSQDADDDYYLLDEVSRRDRNPPASDRTIYANTNLMAAAVFLETAPILKAPILKDMALQAIDFVLTKLYSRDRGVYHYWDGNKHIVGLLTDQIYLCRALLSAVEYAGVNEFIDTIKEVIEGIVQRQSSSHGGFYDIPEMSGARGGLQRRNKSILENAVIAEALVRFHYLTFTEEYVQVAEKCLAAFAKDYHLYGYFTAGYARAVDLFYNKPLYVVIVGPGGDRQTLTLAEEASKHYLASRIILTIDPETEKELASSMEFPLDRDPTAYVCMEKTCHAAIKDARELRAAMMKVDSQRNYRR
jgi:uncharacterized protein